MIKSKLKRRFRKKFHLGEFQEFGFEFSINFKEGTGEAESEEFYNQFIEEVENNNLQFGGGGDVKTMQGFVTSQKRFASPNSNDREKFGVWLKNRREVESFKVGELKDAWNNPKLND